MENSMMWRFSDNADPYLLKTAIRREEIFLRGTKIPLLQVLRVSNQESTQSTNRNAPHFKGLEEQATELQAVCQWMEAAFSMLESSIKPRPSRFCLSQAQPPSPLHQDHRRENASQPNLTIECWFSTFAAILS